MVMNKRGKLILLDFDDTLFFTHGAVRKAAEELLGRRNLSKRQIRKLPRPVKSKVYALAFSKYKHESKPNGLLLNRLRRSRKGYDVIVLTARLKNRHGDTLDLIKKHGVRIRGIDARRDLALPDEEWKLRKIKHYLKKYRALEFYEDKKDNIDYIRSRIGAGNICYYLVTKNSIKQVRLIV